jgi:hypothetical protein
MLAASSFRLDGGEPFSYRDGVLHVGGLRVDRLVGAAGTPVSLCGLDEVAVADRRLEAAFRPGWVVFGGVGVTVGELGLAVGCGVVVDVESADELVALPAAAVEVGSRARLGLRVGPEVEAGPHPALGPGRTRPSSAGRGAPRSGCCGASPGGAIRTWGRSGSSPYRLPARRPGRAGGRCLGGGRGAGGGPAGRVCP